MTDREGGTPPRRLYALSLLIATGVLFGLMFSLTRLGTTNGVPFLAFAFWQSLGAAICIFVYCAVRRQLPRWTLRHGLRYLGMAATGGLIPTVIFAFVAPKLPAGIVSLIIALSPTMTLFIALGIRVEHFNSWRLVGLALGIAGVLLILLPETSLPERGMAIWVLVALAGTVGLGLGNVCAVWLRPPGTTAAQFAGATLCLTAILILPLMLGVHGGWAFDGAFGTGHIALIAIMPLMGLVWCFAMEIARIADAVYLSLFDYLATLAGVGWGILIFAERHSPWIWGALVLLLASITLVTRTTHAVRHRRVD